MARTWSAPEPPSFRLTKGTRLKAIFLPNGARIALAGGDVKCDAITVQMEGGQGGVVPWARVRYRTGEVQLLNLAHVEGVTFADTLPADPGDEGGDG